MRITQFTQLLVRPWLLSCSQTIILGVLMREQIGDESVYFRISELKKGNVQFTDSTNASRLIREHGRDIRYNPAWKKWLVWDGSHWKVDEGGALIHEKNLETVRNFYEGLSKTNDYRERIEIEKFAMISESVRRREAAVKAAAWVKGMNISSDQLDANRWLLNVRNGTINVLTGDFSEHIQEDMITKIANVDYDPQADCPLWKQFIREIMDYKSDVIHFLQTAAGWAITGDTSEQTMFILFGSGANGKTTFLNTILSILGDYGTATPTETFMRKTGDQITNDIARLRGTRFVTTTEAEQGRRLSEPLIKKITGNDQMTARFLYGEFFNFVPTFKIFMATNHKPVIKGTDYGIWRRIKLIPFTTQIPEERQDRRLEEKLRAEASGILNWLLEGTERWQREGLAAPAAILNATDEYRGEMDVIGNFLKECCDVQEGATIRIRELYKAYSEWCYNNNEHAVSERFFSLRLKEMGFQQGRTAEARYWSGLALQV
jgi:putative DNA primase/helicase